MSADVKERGILMAGSMVRATLADLKTETRRIVKPLAEIHPSLQPAHVGQLADGTWMGTDCPVSEWPERFPADYLKGGGFRCPYGRAGDRLWVRETWAPYYGCDQPVDDVEDADAVRYAADEVTYLASPDGNIPLDMYGVPAHRDMPGRPKWRPSIHMPRWASRITLEIDEVRVERLHEIDEEGAKAEGLEYRDGDGDGDGPGAGYKWSGRGYHAGTVGEWGKCFHTPADDGRCRCVVGGQTPAQCAFRELWERINGPGSWDANHFVWVLKFHRIDAVTTETREAAHG